MAAQTPAPTSASAPPPVASASAPTANPPSASASSADHTDLYIYGGLALATLFAGFAAYHGYKRNDDSAGWGVLWGLSGALAWPAVIPAAVLQGYAEPSDSVRLARLEEVLLRPDIAHEVRAKVGVPLHAAKQLDATDTERLSYAG